jgi:signal transduction histidine kinase
VRSREATEWRSGRRGLVLTVADTGIGMDAHTRARVFDAFFTTKGIGGTGLGMWVSSEIMERHGGFIRIRSRQGEGQSGTVAAMFLPFEGVKRPSNGIA